ncbi:Ig-like domain-containing protein [Thiofilum flexile]|uniref:Ig-like domain-containing protein n=1 Tax=Thiofilum flexile TaxID=125627 RepID=UPI0003749D5D|nr:Ig-like domain-containing protein [Thiofilum flexile]
MTNNVTNTSAARTTNWNAQHTSQPNAGAGSRWGQSNRFQANGNSLQSLIALLQTLLSQLMANRPVGGNKPNDSVKPNDTVKPNPNDNIKPQPKNNAPAAVNDARTTPLNTPVSINVLGNDSDPDGDALTITNFSTTSANGGSVSKDAAGNLVYTPKNGFTGVDTFTYTVSDGKGGTATATATVTVEAPKNPKPNDTVKPTPNEPVKPKNNAPAAANDMRSTPLNTAISVDVLANDKDPDGDALTITDFSTTSTQGGSVSKDAAGNLVYTPKTGFTGVDTFTYTVSDGKGGSATATATITVEAPKNAPPKAVADASTTAFNSPTTINVLGNDTDPENDPLSISNFDTTSANGGTISKTADGKLTYTPKTGFSGTDTFSYTISDGKGGSSTTTVTVTVAGPHKPNQTINPNDGVNQ